MTLLLACVAATMISTSCTAETQPESVTGQAQMTSSSMASVTTTLPVSVPITATTIPSTTTTMAASCARTGGPAEHIFPEVPRVGFLFDDAISNGDRKQVVDGVRFGQAFINTYLGGLIGTACVESRVDAGRPGTGSANTNGFVMLFAESGWRSLQGSYPSWHLAKVTAHELAHVWQLTFSSFESGPIWLNEGIAEYIGYYAVIDGGIVTPDRLRSWSIADATSQSRPALESFERFTPSQVGLSYGMAQLAVEYLLRDRGTDALRTYHAGLRGRSWQDAFLNAFGVSASAFYEEFEAYRGRGYR